MLSRKPALVAATPGRLWDLMQDGTGAAAHFTQLASLDFLVLDEADRMVQQGHYQASRRMKWLAMLDTMHPYIVKPPFLRHLLLDETDRMCSRATIRCTFVHLRKRSALDG